MIEQMNGRYLGAWRVKAAWVARKREGQPGWRTQEFLVGPRSAEETQWLGWGHRREARWEMRFEREWWG